MFHNSKPNFTDFKILRNTSTGKGNLSFSAFFHKVVKIKNPEKGTALRNQRKFDVYKKKNGHLQKILWSLNKDANHSKQPKNTFFLSD